MLKGFFDLPLRNFHLDVRFELPTHGITAIFGPSGAGKTSFLRCVAGLERAPRGYLELGKTVWQDESRNWFLPVFQRALGYVFQELRLFSHLNVKANLLFGWKRIPTDERKITVEQVIGLLGLERLLERTPAKLSGGERQRVAIGRALLRSPQLLLMDEPLASLDLPRKREILPFLKRLHRELSVPVLYVSHSLNEVLQLADSLIFLEEGTVLASGSLSEVFAQPQVGSAFRHDLAGAVLKASVIEHDREYGLTKLEFQGRTLLVPYHAKGLGDEVRVHISAKDVSIIAGSPPEQTSVLNILPATVQEIGVLDPANPSVDVQLDIGCPLLARITRKSLEKLQLQPGKVVWAQIKALALTDELHM